jgi:hypothetical protein
MLKNGTAFEVSKCDKKATGTVTVTIPDTHEGLPMIGIKNEVLGY